MTKTTALCSVRVERASWQALRAHRDHELRKRSCQHVDPALTPRNRVVVGTGDAVADAEARIAATNAKVRKNVAEPFITGVITTSPGWFEVDEREERTSAWTDAALGFLRKRFGDGLVAASLHVDEQTPHVHFVVTPIHRWRTKGGRERAEVSPRQALRGRDALARLQDDLATEMAPLGIQRGERGSSAKHERPKRFLARATAEAGATLEVAREALCDAERAHEDLARRERQLAQRERRRDDEIRTAVSDATQAERERLVAAEREAKAFATGVAAFTAGDITGAIIDDEGRRQLHLRTSLAANVRAVLLEDIRPAWAAVWSWVSRQMEALRHLRATTVEAARREGRRLAEAELARERAAARRVLDDAGAALARLHDIPARPVRERAVIATAKREYEQAQAAARRYFRQSER